jgi:glycosyltransferase involved in cell wall biosynthesis
MGIPAARITRTRSGVGRNFLDAGGDSPDPNRGGRILFVGTWLDRKGVLDLVPAVTQTLARVPGTTFTVAGCGVAPAVVRGAFPEQFLGRIDVLPAVESDDALIQLYRKHQVLVLPSYFEGQPLVMLEAAALKLAIVTTGICGMKDFIRDDENGLLVPVADPSALAARLHTVVTDAQLARRLGENAHCGAMSHTWDLIAADYLTAYHAAIRSRRS